jgi:hypothetical protein
MLQFLIGAEPRRREMSEFAASRRAFVKRAAYVAPAILTLKAAPAFAKAGSGKSDDGKKPKKPKKPK